jgi:hypothetical protein
MKSRTPWLNVPFGAIALGPVGNVQGGYRFLNLTTWKPIDRKAWTALPMPEYAVEMVNARADTG